MKMAQQVDPQVDGLLSSLALDEHPKGPNSTESVAQQSRVLLGLDSASRKTEVGEDISWVKHVSHEGDPFLYAKAAEILSSQARQERKMPICRWLRPDECRKETVALVSYPRSGNSMLRGMLEQHYGYYTGSDTRPDRTLSRALRDTWGMAGEGVVDPRLVHIVKSHWPERRGWCPVKADRVILVVRNPFDAMDSYFNMCLTNTHHLSLTEKVYKQFRSTWEEMMCSEASLWAEFHDWWLKCGVPVFIIRYEDLRETPQPTFEALIRWIDQNNSSSSLCQEKVANESPSSMESDKSAEEKGTETPMTREITQSKINKKEEEDDEQTSSMQPQINKIARREISQTVSPYKPRVGGLGKSLHRFEEAMILDKVRMIAGVNKLKRFGYDPGPASLSSSTVSVNKADGAESVLSEKDSLNEKTTTGSINGNEKAIDDSVVTKVDKVKFPDMSKRPKYEDGKCELKGKEGKVVILNDPRVPELRTIENKFGRYMTTFRRIHTKDDTEPLEVVSGEPYRDLNALQRLKRDQSTN